MKQDNPFNSLPLNASAALMKKLSASMSKEDQLLAMDGVIDKLKPMDKDEAQIAQRVMQFLAETLYIATRAQSEKKAIPWEKEISLGMIAALAQTRALVSWFTELDPKRFNQERFFKDSMRAMTQIGINLDVDILTRFTESMINDIQSAKNNVSVPADTGREAADGGADGGRDSERGTPGAGES